MEVDEVVIIVKIINPNAAFRGAANVFDVIVVEEISDSIDVAASRGLSPGGAVSGQRFNPRYGVYLVQYINAGPAAARPVRSKIIHLLWTVLGGADGDGSGLL